MEFSMALEQFAFRKVAPSLPGVLSTLKPFHNPSDIRVQEGDKDRFKVIVGEVGRPGADFILHRFMDEEAISTRIFDIVPWIKAQVHQRSMLPASPFPVAFAEDISATLLCSLSFQIHKCKLSPGRRFVKCRNLASQPVENYTVRICQDVERRP
jgi:hypothetical protein